MRGSAGVITARARCNFLSARSKLPLDGVSCAASLRGQLPGVRCLHVNDVFTRTKGRDWLGIGAIPLIPARLGIMPPLNASSGRDSVDRGQATCGCEIHSALHGRSVPIHFSANKWNREEPRAVSPSNPIDQANGFCHRTYPPHAADKFSDGRRSGPDKSLRLPAKLPSRIKRGNTRDASTTAPEVYTRRLTRARPQQICVPYAMFFPGDTPSSSFFFIGIETQTKGDWEEQGKRNAHCVRIH
ncbi:hypothetical protein ALC57_17555 [Trachymyrmex cornetzi]|uniref:Uncharacterized protein n=1 Tax=Trachymyrmex cornetzi TaxID=471704 RepID=A0A195DBV4_9HYME|nr:hypothetical protein ALC57_17555 [Trachymyrmex cornetzi]